MEQGRYAPVNEELAHASVQAAMAEIFGGEVSDHAKEVLENEAAEQATRDMMDLYNDGYKDHKAVVFDRTNQAA